MVNNYKIIEVIREYLKNQPEIKLNNIDLDDIQSFFSYLVSHNNRFIVNQNKTKTFS